MVGFALYQALALRGVPPPTQYLLGVLADRKENRLRADVISAVPLPDDVVVRLKAAMQRRTGKIVVITKREDPSLIGGVVTRVGDLMYDGSLKTQLVQMKEAMLGRG